MKIASIEVYPVSNPEPYIGGPVWMFVRIDTDDGVHGYGEMFTSQTYVRPETLARVVEDFADDFIVGEDPFHLERLFHKYYNSPYSHVGEMLKSAIFSAFEMACWDVIGKALGRPVHDLLGGPVRSRVRTYTYISAPPEKAAQGFDFWRHPQAVADRAAELVSEGFTALKLDPLPLLTGSSSHLGQLVPVQWSMSALDLAEETIAEIRRAVGSTCDIIIGTHGQMTTSGAIRFAKRLERFEPLWFEEPVPPELPAEMARVARATTIPVAAGERLTSKWEFARLIAEGDVSIINPDVSQVGGLLEMKKIAALAEANGVQITPHVYGGPFVFAASLQLAMTLPNLLLVEGIGQFRRTHAELLDTAIEWRDGYAYPSGRPGLGFELNETRARELRVDKSSRLWGELDGAHDPSEPAGETEPPPAADRRLSRPDGSRDT